MLARQWNVRITAAHSDAPRWNSAATASQFSMKIDCYVKHYITDSRSTNWHNYKIDWTLNLWGFVCLGVMVV